MYLKCMANKEHTHDVLLLLMTKYYSHKVGMAFQKFPRTFSFSKHKFLAAALKVAKPQLL